MSTVLRIGVVGSGLIAQAIHLPRIARLGERPNVTNWITRSGLLVVTS